ncbi:MAG TPA: PDR/VanB family oxidoreductase [Roseateles sp.]|uniref:2Fe-2S iron-sulfur cluster binding domain-containing protein n=1 Tax=Massilia cellulosiltytica TaxID=2683234 RepID=A0A7X3FXR6_9BURK|nr:MULTISPECIES: PDR/VanB family oxidoreductase [Telluria group]KQY15810.1 Vanillate O-demethylase oxidoreductase [Massilia sp. Root133]MVW59921.1 2Fe-2S iron-sulfur cluster binding domain-containing protein [Telluria cellulosilytica]HEU6454862.1 PDR/VanB family oxidoreductase [Roseateles sp.]
MSALNVRVARKTREAEAICSYELVPVDGAALPPFAAGAHVDVHLPNGLVRQYSLCNAPGETHRYLIAVLRAADSRGGSQAMHDDVDVGTLLTISAPKNHFPLVDAARTLLLAGGIGITPILAMAETLAADRAKFEFHYCVRSPERAAFLERIRSAGFATQVQVHYDADRTLDLASLLAAPQPGTHLYVCGPQGFIDHVLDNAKARGWSAGQLHVEYFGAAAADTGGDQPFDVRLAASGRVVTIPVGRTVLKVLAEQGVDIPYSCEEGVCGTCLTRVLEGVPDHRDLYLTDAERAANDQFTPCCSRARTPLLVLDL